MERRWYKRYGRGMEEVWKRYGRGMQEAAGPRGAVIKRVLPYAMKMCPTTLAQVRANHGAVHGTLAEPFVEEVWKRYGRGMEEVWKRCGRGMKRVLRNVGIRA